MGTWNKDYKGTYRLEKKKVGIGLSSFLREMIASLTNMSPMQ